MIVPFLIAIIAWPIIITLFVIIQGKLLMPLFSSIMHGFGFIGKKSGYYIADIFNVQMYALSQIAVIIAAEEIFKLFHRQVSLWLLVPFGIMSLLFIPWSEIPITLKNAERKMKDLVIEESLGMRIGSIQKHLDWSRVAGLGIGWLFGALCWLKRL